jgi:hypothetical protein
MSVNWSAATAVLLVAATFEAIYPSFTDERFVDCVDGPDYTPFVVSAMLYVSALTIGIVAYLRWCVEKTDTALRIEQSGDWFSSVKGMVQTLFLTLRDGVNPLAQPPLDPKDRAMRPLDD